MAKELRLPLVLFPSFFRISYEVGSNFLPLPDVLSSQLFYSLFGLSMLSSVVDKEQNRHSFKHFRPLDSNSDTEPDFEPKFSF